MFSKFNKIISIILTIIFITGIFPPVIFADPNPTHIAEVKGFNKAVIDSHFSKADRELNPERWLAEAKFGVTQAICAWELIAGNLYENPLLFEEAKAQIVKWSDEELEKRFSQWLMGRFFGKAAEEALLNLSSMFNDSQKYYSWHLDEEGNVIFDDKTGDPLVIRPNEEGREFSHDLTLWRNETDDIVKTASDSFNNVLNSLYPELLAYIPPESRESIRAVINETLNAKSNVIKREFENIAAREERIFTNRRTRDIWSLRKKSDDEAARKFTEKLIAETDESCKKGIEELNARIEQASAGTGDLALLGEEWLRLYKEQFERGLKAWEDAEERFFIRRIEWEQESYKLFSEGEAVWLSAFNQFEEERQKWELNAKELFQTGESLFKNISKDFEKTIADAKKEFDLNGAIRIGEGTNRVKALIDMYLISSSAAVSSIENIKYWQNQYGFDEKDTRDTDFSDWISGEITNLWKPLETAYLQDANYNVDNNNYSTLLQVQKIIAGEMTLSEQIAFSRNINSTYFNKNKFDALVEIQNSYNMYLSYIRKSLDIRDKIYENYAELFGTGALKDILSSGVSSDDFYLDEYQIALIRAKALVLYWERKTSIADAVMVYAGELTSGRMTEAEGIRAWEEAKAAYNYSLSVYETELSNLNKIGNNLQEQQKILNNMSLLLQKEEEKLNNLYSDYSSLVYISGGNSGNLLSSDFNIKYNNLVKKYKEYITTGTNSVYFKALEYGLLWEIAEQRETKEKILNILNTNNNLTMEQITELNDELITLSPNFQNELWENNCNSLSALLNDYNLNTGINMLPDVHSICLAIINKPGNFSENTAKFLTDFDNCFSSIHNWLRYEIDNWKNAIINYITTFAFRSNIQPTNNSTKLADTYNNLLVEYSSFLENAATFDFSAVDDDVIDQMNNEYKNICNELRMVDYAIRISESWETMKSIKSTENGINWRQYLLDSYINDKDPSIEMVLSWEEGILADALYLASYYTNRINDSLNIYSQKDRYNSAENAERLFNIYSDEIRHIFFDFNSLNSKYDEITKIAKLIEFSTLSQNDINNKLLVAEENLRKQEEAVNLSRNNYDKEARVFLNIGTQYDNQYKILKIAYDNTDQKRFEYEKQDAIQRWASTSYTNTDNIDYAGCKANLLKAQTVLNVLSDISNNKNNSSNNNPEYEALYSAYEQCFSNKIKVLEAYEKLASAYSKEIMNNENIHQEYQNILFNLGIDFNYNNYDLPESKSEWKIENIITINNGRLAFSRNESMNIIGLSSTEAIPIINFFNKAESVNGEYVKITGYEEALRGLSQRLPVYFNDQNKAKQWSYARNYLLLSLKNANTDLNIFDNYLSIGGELIERGALGSEYIKLNPLEKVTYLSSYMEDNYFYNSYTLFQNEWNSLSDEEKADLEFYVIMTLTTGNDYFSGFKEMYTYHAHQYAEDVTQSLVRDANIAVNLWLINPVFYIWFEPREINKNANNRIKTSRQEIFNIVNRWTNELNNNLLSINNLSALYDESCQKINAFEGIKTDASNIVWNDLESSLLTANIKSEDIIVIKNCWEAIQQNTANTAYKDIFDAFKAMLNWTNDKLYYAKSNLETRFSTDINNQKILNDNFLSVVNDYFNGTADIKTVRTAANNAFNKNTVSIKSYFDNTYKTSIKNLSIYSTTESNLYSLFNSVGEEIITLTTNTIKNKYNMEFSAREMEWSLIIKDITDKYYEWQNTAAQILENGRTDWTESYKKLENAYKQWYSNFQNEYERVNNEWIYAYLAGLEDKEEWLQQAANAANQASSESFLSLIGAEGERLSRFIDTREPLGIRDAVPEAQELMTGLLKSSGIVKMTSTFNSLNNFTNITSPLVKRGVGGVSSWDSSLIKIAASDMARTTNAEIAKSESRKLAHNVRKSADEAIKGLTDMVDTANQNFKESMDNLFILKGLWKKNGDNYVKDIIKGSTVFVPVILETVTIAGYANYIMEPITLRTNLDENYLAGLDTIAIQGLINNVYNEIQTVASEIFGYDENKIKINEHGIEREQSPGEFGAHIGYGPAEKELEEATKNRNEIFYDEGSGELGRLLSDFQYWYAIDKMGSAEFTISLWDKRMWDDEGSWFQAPNLRTVGAIVGTIIAAVCSYGAGSVAGVALSVGIASASEITFGTLDAVYEYRPLDEVFFNVSKAIIINTVTNVIGSAFSGIADIGYDGLIKIVMDNASTSAGKVLASTFMTGTQTITTGIITSVLNGITYDSDNGFGYSGETATENMRGTLTSALTSMVSVFTSSSLTAINSGFEFERLAGFNNLNKFDIKNLNELIGSLAGQGVNYALGNDFTLNVLNLALLSNNRFNSGLLELHLGHDDVTMNFGTGGANVSIDNLASAFRGAQVWDVNTKISKYGEISKFDALIALRAQYGYGDNVQKEQLWDILKGRTLINTGAEEDCVAETTINGDGKRVINLTGYKEGMSEEEQFLLAVVLGYEAYRDGYTIGQTDASGRIVTYTMQSEEFYNAQIAKLLMGDRIYGENKWFYERFEGLAYESTLLGNSQSSRDFSIFYDYLDLNYDNSKDYLCIPVTNGNDYQNYYSSVNLFNSVYDYQEASVNKQRLQAAFERYISTKHPYVQQHEYQSLYDTFMADKDLQSTYGYREVSTTTIAGYGCTFMSIKNGIEALTGEKINLFDLHEYIKKNNYIINGSDNLLSNELMAIIMTRYTNNMYTVEYMRNFGESPTIETLNKIESPNDQYIIHLRITDPLNSNRGTHSVMVTNINYTYDNENRINGIENINVANSLRPSSHINTRTNYLPSEIFRWDTFKVTKNK